METTDATQVLAASSRADANVEAIAAVESTQFSPAELAQSAWTSQLPPLLVSLLERRYLSDFEPREWNIAPREGDVARPLLREVQQLGREDTPGEAASAMPHVLASCQEPGHALVMCLHGDGSRHRLFLGVRRIIGAGARSTTDTLEAQSSALRAHLPGLKLGEAHKLDADEMPELSGFLSAAPTLLALTGIPSPRGANGAAAILEAQSLDRLVRAVGNGRYALQVVCEPVEPEEIDAAIDACRRLKGEVHALTRRSLSRNSGGSSDESRTETEETSQSISSGQSLTQATTHLRTAAGALEFAGGVAGTATRITDTGKLVNPLGLSLKFLARNYQYLNLAASWLPVVGAGVGLVGGAISSYVSQTEAETQSRARQISSGQSWGQSTGVDLLDATAEFCGQLLQGHIDRLQSARSAGWWKAAVYIAAENEAVGGRVAGALRALCAGEATAADPIRVLELPNHLLREAVARGQILSLQPRLSSPDEPYSSHPLGAPFESLATCLNSSELAVLVNVPRNEIPGLPLRHLSEFALSAPPPDAQSIELGLLQDAMGRPLGPVNVARDVLNRHCFITGMSGSGKSNTAVQIILEAYNKLGVPFMVLEPAKAEYRQLARAPELQGKMRVFAIGGEADAGTTPGASTSGGQGAESLPFRLNPLAFVPGVPLGRHIDLLKAVFNASFPMFAGMSYVLEEAIIEVYTERGWSLYTSRNEFLDERAGQDEQAALMPSLQDLHDKIEVVLERKKYGAEIAQNMGAALRSRLKSLLVGNRGMVLNTRRSTPLRLLFEAPAAFEMQNLGDDEEKAFVMALLFVLLYEYAEVRGRDMPPARRGVLQHITLIEEAHRLLAASHGGGSAETGDPRGKAVAMFTDMLAEMRAYGEGFIMADQIPTKLAPETLKNSSLKIVHRLAAPDDRQIAGECMSLSPEQVRHLNSLAPGQAIVHDHRLGEAVQVKIHAAKDQRSALAAQAQKQAPQVLADGTPRPRYTYLHRDAGCRECPAPCTFLHRLLDAPDQKEHFQALRPFFESLFFNGAEVAWARWEAWRSVWRSNARAMRGLDAEAEAGIGVTYCAATRAAHEWLGAVLSARNAAFGERDLQPADRLAREAAARTLCELVMAWVRAPDQEAALSADNTALYEKVRAQVLESVAEAPPRARSGCPSCPARCRLLPFTAPHLLKLDNTIAPILEAPTSARDKLGAIDAAIAHGRAIPLLARQEAAPDASAARRHWIYCLLTNLPTPQKSAAAARGRDEVLALILSAEGAASPRTDA